MSKRVLMAMSGGVDSTMSALMLKEQGYEPVGVYMKLHDKPGYHEENIKKVKRAALFLGIEYRVLDLSKRFHDEVYDYFVQSYKEGITPNPCVRCNRTIKFGALVDFADEIGVQQIATGHYIRCDGEFFYQAIDQSKDQSYFLSKVKKEVLPRLLFPLGEFYKEEIKQKAAGIDALKSFATQAESSEICFVEKSYEEVLERRFSIDMPGAVLDRKGNVIGEHKGYMHYTIGKRRGFFVRGAHEPYYVLSIDAKNNTITVGTKEELETHRFKIGDINLFEPFSQRECEVKVRYRSKSIPCNVTIDGDEGIVELKESVYGVASGQIAAFYAGDRVIGGATII